MIDNQIMTSISIFYYPDINVFKDCYGRTILNMYKLVTPNQIYLFKHKKESIKIVNRKYNLIIKLYYPKNITKEEGGT